MLPLMTKKSTSVSSGCLWKRKVKFAMVNGNLLGHYEFSQEADG